MPTHINNQEFEALLALYNQTHSEIIRYRDIEWKIAGWILAILAGVITLVKINVFPASGKPILQTILSIMTVVIAFYGIWHIHYVHNKLTQNRKLKRDIENCLNLTTKLEAWNFLNKENIYYWEGKGHLWSWWGLIAVFSIYVIIVVWFM